MKELFLIIIIVSVTFLGFFLFCEKTTEEVGICYKIENFKETIKNKKDQFIEERKENLKNEWEEEKEKVGEEVKEVGKNIIEKGLEEGGSFIKNFLEEKKVELME
jgi:iron uptake system EfeUOB component EfeO/EfeM